MAEQSATDMAAPPPCPESPDPGVAEQSATDVVIPQPRAAEAPEITEPLAAVGEEPVTEDLVPDVTEPIGERAVVVPEPRAGEALELEPGVAKVQAAEAQVPKPRGVDSASAEAIESDAEPSSVDAPRTNGAPEQLELALMIEHDEPEPEAFRGRTMHIPYPRQPSS